MEKRYKLPRRTPAQSAVHLSELSRFLDIESRLNRLRLMKKYNVRFEVKSGLVCVFLGNSIVVCVDRYQGSHYVINECLYAMYKTLDFMEGGHDHVK